MTPFWIALQFLTTLPVQLKAMPSPQQNAQSLLFYPLIGLFIGLILFGLATLFNTMPIIMLSVLILVIWIWLTGGLHLDGLADTADAWVGGFGDKNHILKIMKDPSCGPIGVLSLLILCALKFSAIYVLLEKQLLSLLIITPMLARISPLVLFLTTPYVRENGLGSEIKQYLPKMMSSLAILSYLVFSIIYELWSSAQIMMIFMIIFYLRYIFIKRIDGITGDTVGATIEITETLSLFIIVAIISMLYI